MNLKKRFTVVLFAVRRRPEVCCLSCLVTAVACEQAFGRAGWGEGKSKRPVDKHLGPPFHDTLCVSEPDASSYWREL